MLIKHLRYTLAQDRKRDVMIKHTGNIRYSVEMPEMIVADIRVEHTGRITRTVEGQYSDYEAVYELNGIGLHHKELDYFLISVRKLP